MTDRDNLDAEQLDAVVVGAGLAGLYQLHRLRELGFVVRGVEAGEGVGGTWFWNRYPGARCDVPSLFYSYSFSPELEQEWLWSEKYPTQPELLRYINHVADRFDLRRDISFNTKVTGAEYDAEAERWLVHLDSGQSLNPRFLIMATGCLSVPKKVEFSGTESFAGTILNTSNWPHDGVDFSGKRVAVIGTGSSGIQCIPIVAAEAADLTVFQRTPSFSVPATNRPLIDLEVETVRSNYRELRERARHSMPGLPVDMPTTSALDATEDERNAAYQAGWDDGGFMQIGSAYADLMVSAEANDTAAEFIRSKIRSIVSDPAVAELLSPRSYPYGTRRPCLDTGYYDAFNRENVTLVDAAAEPILEVDETGIRTAHNHYDVDIIVLATGFDAMTGALTSIDIRGRDGVLLRDKWAQAPSSYLGLAVAGFPNLFTITGPTSPSVLSNMVVSIEQHVEWIADALGYLRTRGVTEIEATEQAENEWLAHVAEITEPTLYAGVRSWWNGANIPGKPQSFMVYIGGVGPYRDICDAVAAKDYDGFALSPAPVLT